MVGICTWQLKNIPVDLKEEFLHIRKGTDKKYRFKLLS